jgi:hypothetical protein
MYIVERYMPHATPEAKAQALKNLEGLVITLMKMGERLLREEKKS